MRVHAVYVVRAMENRVCKEGNLVMRRTGINLAVTALLLLTLLLTACGNTSSSQPPSNTPSPAPVQTVRIYTSLPLSGPTKYSGISLVNAMRMALADFTGGTNQVGNFNIELVPLDNASSAVTSGSDPNRERVNAYQASADPDAMAYLGPTSTATAQVAIPVLNQAGLTMISPGTTYPGLTKAINNITGPNEPDKYYPTGTRNFFRLLPTDELQGRADASFTDAKLMLRRIFVVDDGSDYGTGLTNAYIANASYYNLDIISHVSLTDNPDNSEQIVSQLKAANPEVIFYGGSSHLAARLKTKVQASGINPAFLGGGGIQNDTFLQEAGSSGEDAYSSTSGIATTGLAPRGAAFIKAYKDQYGEGIQATTIYAYDAMNIALTAIKQAGKKDRAAILAQVAGLKNYVGAAGRISFDKNGDTSLTVFSFYVDKQQKWVFDSVAETSTTGQNPPPGPNSNLTPTAGPGLATLPPVGTPPPAGTPTKAPPVTLPQNSPLPADNRVDAGSKLPPDFKLYRIAGLSVTIYTPPDGNSGQPARVLLALHGMFYNGGDFAMPLLDYARQNRLVLVAPTFNYNVNYKDPQVVTNEDLMLTRQLNQVLHDIPQATGAKIESKVLLFGFSRGAQLGHHFAMFYPAEVQAAAVLSAGAYTLPVTVFRNKPLAFPYGLSNFNQVAGRDFDSADFIKIPFDVQVGLQDNDPNQVSHAYDAYIGNNRVIRAQSFYQGLLQAGVKVQLNLVPNTVHEVNTAQLNLVKSFLGGYIANKV